jgi:hypothetical protein
MGFRQLGWCVLSYVLMLSKYRCVHCLVRSLSVVSPVSFRANVAAVPLIRHGNDVLCELAVRLSTCNEHIAKAPAVYIVHLKVGQQVTFQVALGL